MELEITDQNFEEIISQGKPVVIDFWATWCGPCRRLAPTIQELAAEYEGRVIVGKCDIEENQDLTDRFEIMSVPTVAIIKDGKLVDTVVGASGKAVYEQKINSVL
ncbi:MAG: thioredoxin [Bacteroidaceae bacterium]|nr:thioredoxin [Bacteroidaceae bacterium]